MSWWCFWQWQPFLCYHECGVENGRSVFRASLECDIILCHTAQNTSLRVQATLYYELWVFKKQNGLIMEKKDFNVFLYHPSRYQY